MLILCVVFNYTMGVLQRGLMIVSLLSFYGRRLPMFNADYSKIHYAWYQGAKIVTSFQYDTRPKQPRDTEKEIAEAAKHSFEVYWITRKPL